ncbi:olfactory receptor 7D4-like [Lemur catta]|uniref:olfactory receptor 7D4-like n=1 Tax=Lemur catta TaxID=9447 RepID=UPI001E26850A|nr:olfactory receptor 7D4-like [Lemur catta]
MISEVGKCTSYLEAKNYTEFSEFFLLDLSEDPEIQPILFGLFLSMYLVTVLRNLLIILAVSSDSHLHTPMYFFLSNLSFVDIGFTSTTIPKMTVDILTHSRVISYGGCLMQMSLALFFACVYDMLLTVMAYDRLVAICHPLHYTVIMNPGFCGLLVLISWFIMTLVVLAQVILIRRLTFPRATEVPHFFCELVQDLKVAHSDSLINNMYLYLSAVLLDVFPITGFLYFYSKIISFLVRMSSTAGKKKPFSTCGSHLCVVCLFCGTGVGVYFSSAVTSSSQSSTIASVMYTVVTPMLNPFIYSLRNKDVKGVLGRLLSPAASCL